MRIRILVNYKPSGYCSGRIIDKNYIAPAVMENHGEVTCITVNDEGLTLEEKINRSGQKMVMVQRLFLQNMKMTQKRHML